MPTVTRDIGMGCGRSVVIQAISVVIGLPTALFLVLATVWLVNAFDFQPWVIVVTALLWLVPMGIAAALFVGAIMRRASKLNALFEPLGLTGSAYMSFFRQYHGTVYGRHVDVYLWRGPVLQIEIATPLQTRLGITEHQSDTSFFADMAGKEQLALADPNLAALSVFATDEMWARTLLGDPTATDALRRLTALGSSIFTRQQVYFRPGALVLMLTGNKKLFGIDITPQQARLWVDDLIRVLQVAEIIPRPHANVALSSTEELALRLRKRNPYFELWIGLGVLGFFTVLAAVIFAAVFFFTSLDGF